jgi:DNA-binding PadR family transcriptional regulator
MVSKVDLLLLGLLLGKPMHGYEINQMASAKEIGSWMRVSMTSIYYSLNKLKSEGMIIETVHRSEGTPERSVYHLTEQGRAQFYALTEQLLDSPERPYFDFDLAVFFINRLPKEKAVAMIDRRQRFLDEWEASLREDWEQERDRVQASPRLAIIEHGLHYVAAEKAWLKDFAGEVQGELLTKEKAQKAGLMTLFGDLRNLSLPDVLKLISSGRLTGTLIVSDYADEVKAAFDRGTPVRVSCSESLKQKVARGSKEEEPGPEVSELSAICEAFSWPAGYFAFDQSPAAQITGAPISLSVEQIILEGTRRIDSWSAVERLVPSLETVFEPRYDAAYKPDLRFDESEKRVLMAVDGVKDARLLALELGFSEFQICKTLFSLSSVGLLRTVDQDKVRVRRMLCQMAEAFYQAVVILAGAKEAKALEEEINASGASKDLCFRQGKLHDASDPRLEIGRLVELYKEFLSLVLMAIGARLGSNFAQQSYERILRQLAPELQDIASRYNFHRLAAGKGNLVPHQEKG